MAESNRAEAKEKITIYDCHALKEFNYVNDIYFLNIISFNHSCIF